MPTAKLYAPKNGLAKVIGGADDLTAVMLASRAEARVRGVSDQLRPHVLAASDRLIGLASQSDAEVKANRWQIGELALAICEVAGAAGLDAIGDVARGIRAMTESWAQTGIWHSEGFKLHVDALTLLDADPDRSAASSAGLLLRLRHMRAWLGVAD